VSTCHNACDTICQRSLHEVAQMNLKITHCSDVLAIGNVKYSVACCLRCAMMNCTVISH